MSNSEQRLPSPRFEMTIDLTVRDYECDMGHVVNNAVYLNYLEHARHELLQSLGISFAQLAKSGIDLVVTRIEADFKASLTSGDSFKVRTSFERKGRIRLVFTQSIHRLPDDKLMLNAVVTGAALNERSRPVVLAELETLSAN
ncbi:MAG: acyl-CoA thioesterase [Burkholderiaceae bacterium]|nr:acyl-CoA thioesterase [Burkholderiaceae bacterium]